jgi:hypothetical protein
MNSQDLVHKFSVPAKLRAEIKHTTIYETDVVFFLGEDPYPIMFRNIQGKSQEEIAKIIELNFSLLQQMVLYSIEHPNNIEWHPTNYHCRIVIGGMAIFIKEEEFHICPFDAKIEIFDKNQVQYADDLKTALNKI